MFFTNETTQLKFVHVHTTVMPIPLSVNVFFFLLSLFLFILISTAPAECSSYSKLSEANRASGTHRGNVLKCDRNDLAVGWYRFTDAAGTRMPTSPVAIHHCGTHAPGWMNGQHPTKDDGAVKRMVCFNWNNNVCLWNIEISVRNCGAFFVYRLPRTPNCWLRYCGNQGHSTYSKFCLLSFGVHSYFHVGVTRRLLKVFEWIR